MGYVPEWQRANQNKTSTSKPQQGVRSVELFHNAPDRNSNGKQSLFTRHYADGGDVELNVNGDQIGQYSGNDDIVKYRMNQIDAQGNDLRIPAGAKTTQSQMNVQDMEGSSASDSTPRFNAVMNKVEKEIKVENPAPAPRAARVTSTKSAAPAETSWSGVDEGDRLLARKPDTVSKADPEKVRKAYVEAAEMQRKAKEKPLQDKADDAMFNMMQNSKKKS